MAMVMTAVEALGAAAAAAPGAGDAAALCARSADQSFAEDASDGDEYAVLLFYAYPTGVETYFKSTRCD